MNNMKKDVILFVSIFCVLALISGSTFAYWQWDSGTNNSVIFNTSKGIADYIVYDEGSSYFVGDFQLSDSYCDGIHNTFSFYKTEEASNVGLIASAYMDINYIGANASSSGNVHWTLTEGDASTCSGAVVNSGTITNQSRIGLFPQGQEVLMSAKTYTVWIWIDNSAPDTLSGETIDVNVWTQINQMNDLYGDVNFDGEIDVMDVNLVTAYTSGNITLSSQATKNADVNLDGVVDATDSDLIYSYYWGEIDSLPVVD